MALTSETQPSPNGVNCIEHESADVLNEEDLEDGEIFEDEPNGDAKGAAMVVVATDKPKPAKEESPVALPPAQKKPTEHDKSNGPLENAEKLVPFFIKGKRKHFDDNEEEDNRWKQRDQGKRNRRSREFDRDNEPRRLNHDGEPGEDDEEMMLVRGASPYRQQDWDRERDGEEEERTEIRRPPRTFRGRGGIGRRGERQRGRGRGRGGSMRGNKRKREDAETCIYYLQGKCHRGSDCPYAHEILPPRKLELCKFYMKDCCAKKEKCLYMHSEFPCKYFHTGLKCYANKKCKFSHGILNDTLRDVLAKHLDSAPKDLLGEFARREQQRDQRDRDMRDQRDMRGDLRDMRGDPRDMRGDPRDMRGDPRDMRGDPRDMRGDPRDMRGDPRDMRGDPRDMRGDPRDMRGDPRDLRGEFMRNKSDRERKIPSLFDIKVSIPDDMRNSEGNHTPMPSPTQRSQDSSTRSSDRDRDYSPDKERERGRDRDRERERERERDREHEKQSHEKSERSKEKKARREKAREHRKERKERKEKEKEKKKERSKDALSEKSELLGQDNKNPDILSPTHTEDIVKNNAELSLSTEEPDKRGPYEENGLFPQHLPKKQRELFLRIQQQQREADSSQTSANDDDDEDADKAAEENWYSSDEETTPATSLPSILHNLTQSTSSSVTTTTADSTSSTVMPLLNLLATASAAAKPLDVNKVPSTTTPFIPPNLDLANLSTVFEALTNLQKMSSSANKTVEPQVTTTTIKTDPPAEPFKPEPPRVRDPRLRIDGGSGDVRKSIDSQRRSSEGPFPTDVDLRSTSKPNTDVDLRSLPFKPVQHSAASEIDASLSSHIPMAWQLVPADGIKPDYASLQIQPKPGVNDPRLRRVVRPVTDELGLPRDPRQRVIEEPVRDPRARQPLLATPIMPATPMYIGPPPTPRYDEDHRPQFYQMDSDMRQFPPPTPRMEEEIYTPGPSRPIDPRQRNMSFEDPRRKQFPGRPDDIDLRPPQMVHQVPFINFNK